jgi:hypothetical protein
MATASFMAKLDNSTDENFRLWGKGLSDAITSVGLAKTADTGQIDWATIAKPAALSTYVGYEIRAFSDAIQSSCPIFVKLEYGAYTSSQLRPGVRITVGHETDGAGNFIGATSFTFTVGPTSQDSTTLFNCFVSGANDRVSVVMFVSTAVYYTFGFYIERLKDNSGDPTDSGINIVTMYPGAKFSQFFPKGTGGPFPFVPVSPCCMSPYSGQGSYAGNLGVYPIYPMTGYAANPDLGGFLYFINDIGSIGCTMTISIYGENHTYLLMGRASGNTNGNANLESAIAMRYE